MIRILLSVLLVYSFANESFAKSCDYFFSQQKKEITSVEDFKDYANLLFDNHVYFDSLDQKVLSRFVVQLPKYMDAYKIIFENKDIQKFNEADSKMVQRINSDLAQDKIKRMEVLFLRYQQRIDFLKQNLIESESYKNDILNLAESSTELSFYDWGSSHNEAFQNALNYMAVLVRTHKKNNHDLEESYILAKRTLNRYLSQWDPSRKENQLFLIMAKSLTSGLDPYSKYLTAEEMSEQKQSPTQRYLAGLVLAETLKGVIVKDVIAGGAGEDAGILPGDIITTVKTKKLEGLNVDEVLKVLTDIKTAAVDLKIERQGQEIPLKITRKVQPEKLVSASTADFRNGQILTLKLSAFKRNAYKEFLSELDKAFKRKPVHGLVLDLRGNPGGYVYEALQILRVFLSDQPVLQYSNKEKTQMIRFDNSHQTVKMPLVILLNEGSASASELVAGVLQAEGRALIVGTRSFGKGTAHSLRDHEYGGSQITHDFFHYTNGESPQNAGVVPDIRLRNPREHLLIHNIDHALGNVKIDPLEIQNKNPIAQFLLSIKQELVQKSDVRWKDLKKSSQKLTEEHEVLESQSILKDWIDFMVQRNQVPHAS